MLHEPISVKVGKVDSISIDATVTCGDDQAFGEALAVTFLRGEENGQGILISSSSQACLGRRQQLLPLHPIHLKCKAAKKDNGQTCRHHRMGCVMRQWFGLLRSAEKRPEPFAGTRRRCRRRDGP